MSRLWITAVENRQGYTVLHAWDSVYREQLRVFQHHCPIAGPHLVWPSGVGVELKWDLLWNKALRDYKAREAIGIPHDPPRHYTEPRKPESPSLLSRWFGV
jgi:hypothetical protein